MLKSKVHVKFSGSMEMPQQELEDLQAIIDDKKKTTAIALKIDGEVTVPLPGLMKMVIVPVVQGEFEKLVEQYIDNLIKRFGGEA